MAVSNLSSVVNATFVQRFQGLSSGTGSVVSNSNSSNTSISAGLRLGAQTFGKAVQGLNAGISFLNISKATLEELTEITDKLIGLAERSTKVTTSADARKNLNLEFQRLATEFENISEEAKFGDRQVLNLEEMEPLFTTLGLHKERSDSIAQVFKKFTTPEDDQNLASQAVKGSRPYFVPTAAYANTLARSSAEYETIFDGTVDISNRPQAYRMLHDLHALRDEMKTNIKGIDNAVEVIGKNLDLVRAAGFAFLDLSSSITSDEDAEKVAAMLRDEIRKNARGALAQAENLQSIVVAALALTDESLTSSGVE